MFINNRGIRSAVLLAVTGVGILIDSTVLVRSYPTRPIKFIVSFPSGTGSDLTARIVGEFITSQSGQPVTIENRTGAGGNIGMDAVAKAVPDGHTLGVAAASNIVINPYLYKHMPFDPIKDLLPIAPIAEATLTITINASLPANTLQEFIALAKANPRKFNYGSGGVGSISHLGAVQFARAAGIELVHVPYRGIVQAVTDLAAGHIDLISGPIGPVMGSMPSQKLRVLAAFSPERLPYLPDTPTATEAGLAHYDLTTWFGVVAPRGTPEQIVLTLNGYLQALLQDPSARRRLLDNYLLPMAMTPDAFSSLIASDLAKWKQVTQDAKIAPE